MRHTLQDAIAFEEKVPNDALCEWVWQHADRLEFLPEFEKWATPEFAKTLREVAAESQPTTRTSSD
jgi:hypothetical protein